MSTHNICFCAEIRKQYLLDNPSYLELWSVAGEPTICHRLSSRLEKHPGPSCSKLR